MYIKHRDEYTTSLVNNLCGVKLTAVESKDFRSPVGVIKTE